ncbi:MAG: PfkB family carbohydrate kinase [Bacteroidota bacterium]
MILTVTLNPLLERRLFFDSVELGKSNRSEKEFFTSGGKGINVSKQLNSLSEKNSALTFLGGNNGKILRHCFTRDKIDFTVVSTKSETRSDEIIIEEKNNRVTTYFSLNSNITVEEAADFKHKLDKMIQNCSIVVFAGSSPCIATDDIFPYGIELANRYDKISILDTYGSHLMNCINAGPTVIHNNVDEVERSLGITLHDEKEKLEYLHQLYAKNIKLMFLSDGAKSLYAEKFDFNYKVDPPKVNVRDATGSGDAFVAGIAYGLENSLVFDEFLKIGIALGAANASKLTTCDVTIEEMNSYIEQVKVSTIGKKMKIIDDSPRY